MKISRSGIITKRAFLKLHAGVFKRRVKLNSDMFPTMKQGYELAYAEFVGHIQRVSSSYISGRYIRNIHKKFPENMWLKLVEDILNGKYRPSY